jgi:REP element-mobilizing transposase RayT
MRYRENMPNERKHRLPRECYIGHRSASFTAHAAKGCAHLANKSVFDSCLKWLREACAVHQVDITIFTVMPDHMHVLLIGMHATADLLAAMTLFKQKCGFYGRRELDRFFLQKDFYDHVFLGHEDVLARVRYIAANPCRKELASAWDEYPYTYYTPGIRM